MVILCRTDYLQKKRMVINMENKTFLLNKEVECLKEELYDLLENEPWAQYDILRISTRLDNLIIKFYKPE
ncbi:aspartyl-phosphate phosphatase Spo0E family protein [Ruminiclostridium hungatei]|uniref:aspartyl-phosphate phosphatase Spo0E family protein n=1 Tax=Ruminiclostridium hungatei TaxID=48256 RepID=UPI0030EC7589